MYPVVALIVTVSQIPICKMFVYYLLVTLGDEHVETRLTIIPPSLMR